MIENALTNYISSILGGIVALAPVAVAGLFTILVFVGLRR